MGGYSQAIHAGELASPSTVRVSLLANLLLPSLGTVVFAVTLLQVLFLSQGSRALFRDNDTGWHIRNGEAILSSGTVPRNDSFSYTRAGSPWLAWEWLTDVLWGSAHRTAGLPGVALLTALIIALAAWGAARLALSLGGNLFFTAAATVLLLSVTSLHWLARPHVFSWLLALLFLAIAEWGRHSCLPSQPDNRRWNRWLRADPLWICPGLACLWSNAHGSFLLGPGILFLYAVGEWLQVGTGVHACTATLRPRTAGRRFAAASLASLLATYINPYGWDLHAHVLAYLRNPYLMDHIMEFRSFDFHGTGAIYVELFLLVAVLGAVALVRQRAYGPALLAVALLHLSLYSARHLALAAVLLLPLSVVALTQEAKNRPLLRPFLDYSERLRAIDRRVCGMVPVVLVLAATVVGLGALARADRVGFDPAKFPVRAADFLEQRSPALQDRVFARVFTKDQWGGYLIYRFQGQLKVFVDGRSDFYGQDFLETYSRVVEVKPGWDAVLRQFGVRFVLTPPDHALASALSLSIEWKRVYADSVAAVFERM